MAQRLKGKYLKCYKNVFTRDFNIIGVLPYQNYLYTSSQHIWHTVISSFKLCPFLDVLNNLK